MVLNFIIAGRDTTACTLSWTFYQLSQNPAVQQVMGSQIHCLWAGRLRRWARRGGVLALFCGPFFLAVNFSA